MAKTDDMMHELAVELILAIMKSASTEKIRPADWWERAHSALRSAAVRAGSFGNMVALIGRKLQITFFSEASSEQIHNIGALISRFEAFRVICERDALYIVAEAQAVRSIRKTEQGAFNADNRKT